MDRSGNSQLLHASGALSMKAFSSLLLPQRAAAAFSTSLQSIQCLALATRLVPSTGMTVRRVNYCVLVANLLREIVVVAVLHYTAAGYDRFGELLYEHFVELKLLPGVGGT